jgi:hypothetical protein
MHSIPGTPNSFSWMISFKPTASFPSTQVISQIFSVLPATAWGHCSKYRMEFRFFWLEFNPDHRLWQIPDFRVMGPWTHLLAHDASLFNWFSTILADDRRGLRGSYRMVRTSVEERENWFKMIL